MTPREARARADFSAAVGHLQRGDIEQGEALLKSVMRVFPSEPGVLQIAGAVALERGRRKEAIALLAQAIEKRPGNAEAHSNIGLALTGEGRLDEAERHLRRAIELAPTAAGAWVNLGGVHRARGAWPLARDCFRRAAELAPELPLALVGLASAELALGNPLGAEELARRSATLSPSLAEAHQMHGRILDRLGRMEQAVAAHRRAISLSPRQADVHADLATTLLAYGRREEAVAAYRQALLIEPARADLRQLATLAEAGGDLRDIEARYRQAGPRDDDRMHLGFALARALEGEGRFEEALTVLVDANAIKRRDYRYDRADSARAFADISASFTAEVLDSFASAGDPNTAPIFVLGMPRSGTTLVEQILASHDDVFGGGELPLLRDLVAGRMSRTKASSYGDLLAGLDVGEVRRLGAEYVTRLHSLAPAARFITDKMPGNFLLVGVIRMALPNARIVHCVRDPADTCVSIFKNLFSSHLGYAYDLAELGHYYRLYEGLMAHWHAVAPGSIHTVSYEALVADQEGETRRLLAACGLDFQPRCLRFFETVRPVHTASVAQVRNPINSSSVGIAARYGEALAPLHAALRGEA